MTAKTHRRTFLLGWAIVALLALGIGQTWFSADPPTTTSSVAQLPDEERSAIQATIGLIRADGPRPYAEDGSDFGNREGRLPQKGPGYYREYTVETAGAPDRGARRIVSGRNGELYYTRDHYQSFIRIE